MMCRLLLLVAAALVGACGAGKQSTAAPQTAAVVQIPGATPKQLQQFDADQSAPPGSSAHHPIRKPTQNQRYVEVDDDSPRQNWPGSGSRGGPDCVAAALCCERILQKNGAAPSSMKMCDSIRHAPDTACQQIRDSFRRAFGKTGVRCP